MLNIERSTLRSIGLTHEEEKHYRWSGLKRNPSFQLYLPHLLQLFHQQFLFPPVFGHCDCALNFVTSFGEPAQLHKQVSADAVQQMVTRQDRLSSESIQRIEPIGWALCHSECHRPIQRHNGGWADPEQSVVEKDDPLPVGFCSG